MQKAKAFPHQLFSLKKRYQQKDTYVLVSTMCLLIFTKAFDGNEFPTSEERIGITSSIGIEFSPNIFGPLRFQQLHQPIAKHQLTGHAFEHPLRQR